ncbi:hypothetical protein ACFQJ7_04130 [Halovenus rubra]|uniref:Uncharacterized protein n=2 Tax=Halovenus rubra TaxID=869890 RepID=A0ACC7DY11_9EURY|nr:hypothetical protein [Halovenus rubra]
MSKKWTRRSALALIGSGAGLLAVGTGGFTETDVDRTTDVDTSSDGPNSNALLGINPFGGQLVFEAETRELVELTNNTGEQLDTVSATVENNPALPFNVEVETTPNSLDPGSSGTLTATITGASSSCEEQSGVVKLEIFASSSNNSDTDIKATRTIDISLVNCLNFETASTTTPLGFIPDTGNQFALRDGFDSKSTLEYGWNRDQTTESRDRNTVSATEENTLNHFVINSRIPTSYDSSQDAFWKIDLPAGWYDVRMRCHDPDYLDQEYSFDVDGGAAVVPLRDPEFADGSRPSGENAETYNFTVEVVDGKDLSIIPPDGTYNPKVSWLQFQSLEEAADPATFDVDIFAYDSPVDKGDTAIVDVEIENTGDQRDIQPITLDVAGQGQVDSETIALTSGETTQIQLEWDTDNINPGPYDLTAASEDTSDTATTDVSGEVKYEDGTANTGQRARYEQDVVFDIVNNRAREIKFTGIRVESTNTSADRIKNTDVQGDTKEAFIWVTDEYDPASRGDHDYDNKENNGPPYFIDDNGQSDRLDMGPNGSTETLASGDTATVELTAFRSGNKSITMGGTEVSEIKVGDKTDIGGTTLDVTLFFEMPDGTERSKTLTIDGVSGNLEFIRDSKKLANENGSNDILAFNVLNNDAKNLGSGPAVEFSSVTVKSTSTNADQYDGNPDLGIVTEGTSYDYTDNGSDGFSISQTVDLSGSGLSLASGEDARWNLRGFEEEDGRYDDPVDLSGEDVLIEIEYEDSSPPGGGIRFKITDL